MEKFIYDKPKQKCPLSGQGIEGQRAEAAGLPQDESDEQAAGRPTSINKSCGYSEERQSAPPHSGRANHTRMRQLFPKKRQDANIRPSQKHATSCRYSGRAILGTALQRVDAPAHIRNPTTQLQAGYGRKRPRWRERA